MYHWEKALSWSDDDFAQKLWLWKTQFEALDFYISNLHIVNDMKVFWHDM